MILKIVGNYGGTAGIAEALVQSHAGTLHLLPAISSAYTTSFVRGLMTRGGFEVGIDWKDGKLVKAAILSKIGSPLNITLGASESFLAQGGDVISKTTPRTVYAVLPN